MPNYHVIKRPEGWAGKKEGASKATFIVPTQKEAEKLSKQIVHNQGGGEVRIHSEKGPIRDSDTVKPAVDPNPPKDNVY